jgi:tRNA(Ile)-lysidine synthase
VTSEGDATKGRVIVAAVSGGPDSMYLLRKFSSEKGTRIVIGHVNYGTRGIESEKDQKLVERIGRRFRYETVIHRCKNADSAKESRGSSGPRGDIPAGFEEKAREIRYRFLKDLAKNAGADAIALAHTADDQVETILMRVFEGAGIGGLKGIPRGTDDGILRPILDEWKEDINDYLKKRKIPFRIDRSNIDTRFERNWVRHVLIPLLEKRYGRSIKKRIYTLGERFRELDDYLEAEAGRWIRRNVKCVKENRGAGGRHAKEGFRPEENCRIVFRRKSFSALPPVLRVKILQRICFERLGVAPNERLLKAMDGSVSAGGPSARVNAGKGWKLVIRYEEALFVPAPGGNGKETRSAGSASGEKLPIPIAAPGEYKIPMGRHGRTVAFAWESGGRNTPAQAKRLAAKGGAEVFDAAGLALPLTVRPLRAGDRIRPFGGSTGGDARHGGKKAKEILIDRKVPREERWGRPVVCDAEGAILWIPGVLRSALAPVTPATRKTEILRIRSTK